MRHTWPVSPDLTYATIKCRAVVPSPSPTNPQHRLPHLSILSTSVRTAGMPLPEWGADAVSATTSKTRPAEDSERASRADSLFCLPCGRAARFVRIERGAPELRLPNDGDAASDSVVVAPVSPAAPADPPPAHSHAPAAVSTH